MIVREILQNPNLADDFDFFNDYKDTMAWLKRCPGAGEIVAKLKRAEVIDRWTEKIRVMSHHDMARFFRFTPSGHPVFDDKYSLYKIFGKRFEELRGMTAAISKQIGHDATNPGDINDV